MPKHPYKLIAVDLDGTLLNDDSQVSKETAEWLSRAQAAGIHVCFATGRGRTGAYTYMEQLGLPGPFVLVNGSEIWATKDKLHLRHTMPVEDILALREIALAENVWYWGYATDGVYNKEKWHPNPLATEWLKFGFNTDDLTVLARIQAQAETMGRFEITNSDIDNIELNPKGISKATGLQEVCKMLNIEMHEIVAFGDSRNDLKMLQAVGLGVAMGNAQQVVKDSADCITLTNDEHGIAVFIQDHLL